MGEFRVWSAFVSPLMPGRSLGRKTRVEPVRVTFHPNDGAWLPIARVFGFLMSAATSTREMRSAEEAAAASMITTNTKTVGINVGRLRVHVSLHTKANTMPIESDRQIPGEGLFCTPGGAAPHDAKLPRTWFLGDERSHLHSCVPGRFGRVCWF